ncbi:MAG TPA: winged helix-turn-helix domain-containing protein [Opitutaceae bacterium]|nr:winged helix-turn-helix domain-containing protein [Opitutaceae bacterium]
MITIGDLALDTTAKSVERSGKVLELTAHEFGLLLYLARRQGEVISRSEIEAHIYSEEKNPMSNVVDSAICTLRKKIASVPGAPLIHTRRGGFACGSRLRVRKFELHFSREQNTVPGPSRRNFPAL